MRLLSESESCFSGNEKTYRQSRAIAALRAVIIGGLFAGSGPLWIYLGAPWFVSALCLLFAMFVVPFFVKDVWSTWRSTNWLMRLDRGGLWLNMRGYSHRNFEPAETVIETTCRDIESVSKLRSKFVAPTDIDRGSTSATSTVTLRIRFREPIPTEIVEALRNERERVATRQYLGLVTVSVRSYDDPISVADDRTLAILWHSQNVSIRPSVDAAIAGFIEEGVAVDAPETRNWLWNSLTPEERTEMIAEMENHGQVLEAKRLKARPEENRPEVLVSP